MIAFVEGTLAQRSPDRVVVSAGGLGYQVLVSTSTLASLPPVGNRVRLLTRMQVRDDEMLLFGFATAAERDLFELLVGVGGVGPKMATAVLSTMDPESLRRAVLDGDLDAVTSAPGVGRKLAARIVVDLKDKLGGEIELPSEGPLAEVREALAAMGLSPAEIQRALADVAGEGRSVEDLLREALQAVGGADTVGARGGRR